MTECKAEAYRECQNDLLIANSILEAINEALNGNEPSDFMLSFPIVRKAWDLYCENLHPRT